MWTKAVAQRGFTLIELMIVVAVIGILSAAAVPSVIGYIRESKTAEVHVALDRCYQAVKAYYDGTQAEEEGSVLANRLPKRMNRWVCPGRNFGKRQDLDGSARFIDTRVWSNNGAEAFADIGFSVNEATHACYQYRTNTNPRRALRDGDWFRCQAMTDLDDDDRFAYWYKTGTYAEATGTFQGGAVHHLESGDDF